jgi:hypothetical protein
MPRLEQLRVAFAFGMKATYKEPHCLNSGVLFPTAFSRKQLTTPGLADDDRPMTRASGADDIKQPYTGKCSENYVFR